ncbi:MAG: hypothetical protein GEU88_19070, partial [Solirubrobacterales bacterium]|nr:hypothetical protein [Solirubrobacterales bacterium]
MALRRPLRAGVRRARLPALERRRTPAARAARRPDLGGHQRDPAPDREPRAGASRGRGDAALTAARAAPVQARSAHGARRPAELDLRPLLVPRSVAVVGANDRPGSYADTVLRNLERAGFEGDIWGVHPTRDRVHDRECVPSVLELPEPVDALVVAIPAPKVPAVIADAVERGCGGAIVFAAGFGEVAEGRELERELREVALAGGLPVCGPNGNGVVSVGSRAPLWGDSAPPLRPGRVAMVSQSGNVAVNAIGSRRGIDFHTLVSTGNQAVIGAGDWLAALAELEGVGAVAMFCESDDDGARLAEGLARCAERGIGVAVLKVGSSRAGARSAAAHTGALAGDQRVFRALIEEAGAAWAADPHDLLELARAFAEPRARPRGDGGLRRRAGTPAPGHRPQAGPGRRPGGRVEGPAGRRGGM